jgi:hypothetical protein
LNLLSLKQGLTAAGGQKLRSLGAGAGPTLAFAEVNEPRPTSILRGTVGSTSAEFKSVRAFSSCAADFVLTASMYVQSA